MQVLTDSVAAESVGARVSGAMSDNPGTSAGLNAFLAGNEGIQAW